jgi:putative ABC transport system permease protein
VGELFGIAAEALARYKLRTGLSVLGVVLGVAAVIAMMSVSEGARHDALQQMQLLGLDNIVVRNRGLGAEHPDWRRARGITTQDAYALRELLPLVVSTSPLVERYQPVSSPRVRKRLTSVVGVMPDYQNILRLGVARGRFLAPSDVRDQARVCVLGQSLGPALFGFRDPLGQSLQLDRAWYQVVGVLDARASDARGMGALAGRDLNQVILVPLPTLLSRALDLDPRQRVDEIWVRFADGSRVVELGQIAEHTLLRLHRLPDFEVVVPRELLRQRFRTQRTFSVVVGSVAIISLLVGGIGIMNIMLASVLERTREIGIRRTVGATRRDVTLQFLAESLLMTVSGGSAGILLGAAVSWGITAYAAWTTRLSPLAVVLGFCVSVVVGLVFGIYPARKAAGLEPIDAVRYE